MVTIKYDDRISGRFLLATVLWGIVGMFAGVLVAAQLADWRANLGNQFTAFGRLRPLHTNAAIFAFAGNAIFCAIYYSTQRLCKARMWSDLLSKIHFWGWQLIIVGAALTLPFGITHGKEYAELEWFLDIAIAVVWVVFAINFFMTLIKRREKHMYVALWFYIATIITVAVLHIGNSIELPVTLLKSYPVYAGVQDALVQWWYGHNAVAFFLTTPFLGLMYYFIPKAAERPVYSYRLSIVHFWALVFIYIWAGPHHLLYTALPDWAQNLGMVFSLMLIAPSWGGMINGLLTLRGAWHKLRTEPVLKFFVVGVTFYGMSTFEGPMLSIKSVNALAHYTDWIIGHVHSGTLGWNGFMTFGMIYWLLPRLWGNELWSKKMATAHFWIGLIGIVIYVVPMWFAGVTQGLMWREFTAEGVLAYPNFMETLTKLRPLYMARFLGGFLFFIGAVMCAINVVMTIRGAEVEDMSVDVPDKIDDTPIKEHGHRLLESKVVTFSLLTLVAILIGGLAEYIPTYLVKSNIPTIASVKPYTALELAGRDLYIKEGCYTCHSQMVRPFRDEVVRYGEYSKAGEFIYDRPFQWGSRRIGPDLHRIGGKYNNLWHLRHMENPRSIAEGSLMPNYDHMLRQDTDYASLPSKLAGLKLLGTPYTSQEVNEAIQDAKKQAALVAKEYGERAEELKDKEITALIAYLQRLGTDINWRERQARGEY